MSHYIYLIFITIISITPDMLSMDRAVDVKKNTKKKDRSKYDEWGNEYRYDKKGNRYDSKGTHVVFINLRNVPQEQSTAHSSSSVQQPYHSSAQAVDTWVRDYQTKVQGRSDFAANCAFVEKVNQMYAQAQKVERSNFSLARGEPLTETKVDDALSYKESYPSFKHDKKRVVEEFQSLLDTATPYAIASVAETLDDADFAVVYEMTHKKLLNSKYRKKIEDRMVRLFEKNKDNPLFIKGIPILWRHNMVKECAELVEGKVQATPGAWAKMAALARKDPLFERDLIDRYALKKVNEMEALDTYHIMNGLARKHMDVARDPNKESEARTVEHEKKQLLRSAELYQERFQTGEFRRLLREKGEVEKFNRLMSVCDEYKVADVTGMEVRDFNQMANTYNIDRVAFLQPLKNPQQMAVRQQALTLLKDCRNSPGIHQLVGQGVSRVLELMGKDTTVQEAQAEIQRMASSIRLMRDSSDPLLKNLNVDGKFAREVRAIEAQLAAHQSLAKNREIQLIGELAQMKAPELPVFMLDYPSFKQRMYDDFSVRKTGRLDDPFFRDCVDNYISGVKTLIGMPKYLPTLAKALVKLPSLVREFKFSSLVGDIVRKWEHDKKLSELDSMFWKLKSKEPKIDYEVVLVRCKGGLHYGQIPRNSLSPADIEKATFVGKKAPYYERYRKISEEAYRKIIENYCKGKEKENEHHEQENLARLENGETRLIDVTADVD